MAENKTDAILAALPWRCFHCDFVTNDREEAAAHFGGEGIDDDPICNWWRTLSEDERLAQAQLAAEEINRLNREIDSLSKKVEGLEYQVGSVESSIQSYKPFRGCHSIYDVFCVYDSMEGRALAAEEKLQLKEKV